MEKRALIVALLVGTTLVAAVVYVAVSYLALASAVGALPKTLAPAQRAAPVAAPLAAPVVATRRRFAAALRSRAAATAETDRPRITPPEPAATDGEHALRAAMERDPDIAALVNDRDPQISGAMRAFFVDDQKP